jgi:folate-binding protein YgfZ
VVISGRAPLELLIVAGRDRERLLHGLTTGEVRKLAPGGVTHGFFTTSQGRILADYRLVAREASFWLLLPQGTSKSVAAQIEKYKLASEVEIRSLPETAVFEILGEPSVALRESASGGEVVLIPDPAARAPRGYCLPADSGALEAVESWLGAAEARGHLRRASEADRELVRIEAGELRFGIDFGPENFPQETGRESAVSYTKGCFLGQEVVARIHYRGGVQKRPVGVRFDSDAPPPAGAELRLDGRAVGRATSVADSPVHGAIGLGIVHQRGAETGTRLEVEGAAGGFATVVALPFETSH